MKVANGPKPTLTTDSRYCGAASYSGHSRKAQHFVGSIVGLRDFAVICARRKIELQMKMR
jgi:hypothetical protein